MTPKEKAIELYDLYRMRLFGNSSYKTKSIQCAIIAVDTVLESGKDVDEFCDSYWQEVKEELIKLKQ